MFARIGLKADQAPADRFLGAINGIKKDIIGAIAGTRDLAGSIKAVNTSAGASDVSGLRKNIDNISQSSGAAGKSLKTLEWPSKLASESDKSGKSIHGIKPAAKEAGEQIAETGRTSDKAFRQSREGANNFASGLKDLKKEIINMATGALTLAGAIKAVESAMGDAMELKKFSDATGASTDRMQQWRAVADQVSGSGAAVGESIKAIASNQDKIKLGQGNISGYQLLGIDPRQDPFKVLEQIREKTAKLAPAMRRNVIGMFGVSTDLISTLDLTNKQFDKMAGRAYVISPAMIDGLNRERGSMETVKNALNYFVAEMATKLGPTIEKVSAGLIRFIQFVERGVIMIDKAVRSTIDWKTAILGIVAVLAVMNAGFLLSPIGLFTMAIILLMAVMEDLYVYSNGGDSLFGVLMQQMPGLGNALKGVFGFITDAVKAIKDFFGGDQTAFNNFVDKWGALGLVIKLIAEQIKNVKDIFDALLKGDWDTLFQKMGPIGAIISALAGGAEGMKKWEGQLKASGANLIQSLRAAYSGGSKGVVGISNFLDPRLKLSSVPGGGATNQVFNFNITGISDPAAAAREVKNMFQREMQKTQNQGARGKAEK